MSRYSVAPGVPSSDSSYGTASTRTALIAPFVREILVIDRPTDHGVDYGGWAVAVANPGPALGGTLLQPGLLGYIRVSYKVP